MLETLSAWSNFYVITGSSAAGLTGLMFIVITLVMGVEAIRKAPDGVDTFSTPTVVHLCVALLASAILSAPWRTLVNPAVILGLIALFGLAYVAKVMRRTKRMTVYQAELEDYVWYVLLPGLAYVTILAGAICLPSVPVDAMYVFAVAVLLLIFIGIHNAWDIVTFIAVGQMNAAPRRVGEGQEVSEAASSARSERVAERRDLGSQEGR
jgi:hypothetical protein